LESQERAQVNGTGNKGTEKDPRVQHPGGKGDLFQTRSSFGVKQQNKNVPSPGNGKFTTGLPFKNKENKGQKAPKKVISSRVNKRTCEKA